MPRESALFKPQTTALVTLAAVPPAIKIAAVLGYAVCASLLQGHGAALAASSLPWLLALAGRLPLGLLARRLVPVNIFFVFFWLFLPINMASGSLAFSRSGVELAALITLKGNAVAAMLLVLLGSSTVSESCRGLLRLHVPEKLVTLLLITYSNLAHMHREYATILAAAKLRGFVAGKTLSSYKTTAWLAAMLLVRSWQRAQRVNKAMLLRGFSGQYPLLELPPAVPYNAHGMLFFAVLGFLSAALLLVDVLL